MAGRPDARDMAEAAALATEIWPVLFAQAYRMTGDRAESEDLAQEAFTAALAIWGEFGSWPRQDQVGWLHRVMICKKIDRWRVERRRSFPLAEVPDIRGSASAETEALNRDTLARVDAVIRGMPPERRKVAFLRWYCGWTTKEIADWNGIAPSTVRGHLMRALKELNDQVRPELLFTDDVAEGDREVSGKREEVR